MTTRTLRSLAAAAALVLLAGCASTPEPIHRENLKEVEATVVEVNKADRLLIMRRPDSHMITFLAGPEVRNFDQIRVGDTVVTFYYEAISFRLKDAGEAARPGTVTVGAGRAPVGAQPGAAGLTVVETTVTFQSYEPVDRIVTFTDEDGRPHVASVWREDGHEFAKKLKPGDQVVITATQAVAVRVEPGR